MPRLQNVEDTPRPASAPTDALSPAAITDRLLEAFGEAERLVELINRRLREVRDLLREEAGARTPGCRPQGEPSRDLAASRKAPYYEGGDGPNDYPLSWL